MGIGTYNLIFTGYISLFFYSYKEKRMLWEN
nr:MAG TPA: hypothetical protein [Caudoviricetes sp.]